MTEADRSDDLHAYLPDFRRVRRVPASGIEGLYMPSFNVGVVKPTNISGLGGFSGGAAGAAEDMEMRLAWLHSEVGNEELALERWHQLWLKVNSIPRRRYVEDRLLTVAARLAKLADIAIEMERRIFGFVDGLAADAVPRQGVRENDQSPVRLRLELLGEQRHGVRALLGERLS